MKKGTQDHAKFNTLKAILKVPRYVVSGLLEELWSFAATSAISGDVGRYSNFQIAANMEWDGDPDELINALVESGWLDQDDESRLVVHDWFEHCPDWVKKRISRAEARLVKNKPSNRQPETSDSDGQRHPTADNGGQREKTSDNGALTQSSQVKSSQAKPNSAQPDGSGHSPDPKIPNVEKLDELIDAFEKLPSAIGHQIRNHRSKEIIKGWSRVQKDPEWREAFEDIPTLMTRIRDGTVMHGTKWWCFLWLFKTGELGEKNVLKILDGKYEHGKSGNHYRDVARIDSGKDAEGFRYINSDEFRLSDKAHGNT